MKRLIAAALIAATATGCAVFAPRDERVEVMWTDYTNRQAKVQMRLAARPRPVKEVRKEDPIEAEKRKLAELERKARAEARAKEQARKRAEREEFLRSLRKKREMSK